jgi:hypothetical protein
VGVSRDILQLLSTSIQESLAERLVTYELYRQNLQDIESRSDIRDARIAIYEQAEDVTTKVGDYRANLARATYGIDISVIKGYINNNAEDAELRLLDLKDKIMDWAQSVQPAILTDEYVHYFSYQQQTGIQRNPKFVTATLIFVAQRDYYKPQNTTLS